MRIRFIADIRSLIARNWISYFPQAGHEVRVISTFPREQNVIPGTTIHALPLAFSWAGETSKNSIIPSSLLFLRSFTNKIKDWLHLDVIWWACIVPLLAPFTLDSLDYAPHR
ncbi:hypothetical protein JGI17_10012 [Candidatus Kryptonium thompsonii]|jgi:hypothetical protein|nr:hypothetical protein JGI17_10012 [Candidatus Kryptonium thompsoni]